MKVVWSLRAIRQLLYLHEYIARDSEKYADLVAARILDFRYSLHNSLPDRLERMAVFHGRQRCPMKL